MSTPERTFHPFPRLPTELQLAIWRKCLPRRVLELDVPFAEIVFDLEPEAPPPCRLGQTTYMNGRPPVISRVCRISRSVAFETGSFPDFSDEIPPWAYWSSDNSTQSWLDTVQDSIHLNWTPLYAADFNSVGSPLHCLAWDAAYVGCSASFMIDYFCLCSRNLESEGLDALRRLPSWTVIIRVIIIHTDRKTGTATGLFGLLGDARVQLVDVSDEARVNTFFDLAEACERHASVNQDLHRESVESIKQKLQNTIVDTIESESLLPPMRPAIMFRLCTEMCNASVEQ